MKRKVAQTGKTKRRVAKAFKSGKAKRRVVTTSKTDAARPRRTTTDKQRSPYIQGVIGSSTAEPAMHSADELCRMPFPCVNCFSVIEKDGTSLYCSEVCAQAAGWVRYFRRCRLDGRLEELDVRKALRIRLALVLGGGYPRLKRTLPEATRRAVSERDRRTCQVCGRPGTEIDHKHGSSNDLENLQLLCDSCHNEKTISTFVRITKESHPEAWDKMQALHRRARAPRPIQLCDAEVWTEVQNELLRRRRAAVEPQGNLFNT